MAEDRFTYLLTRKLSGEITSNEEKELDALLQLPAYSEKFHWVGKFWEQKKSEVKPDVEKALQKVMTVIQAEEDIKIKSFSKTGNIKRLRKISVLAFVFILIIAVNAYFIFKSEKPKSVAANMEVKGIQSPIVEKQNTKGARSIIILADGTKIWLNADSKLQYPKAFNGNTREISLTGEAFFEVAKNKQKPFIIHLQNSTVRVLGTSFNIKAYEGSNTVETSVLTGRVAFIPAIKRKGEKKDTTFLTHNMKVVYETGTGEIKTSNTISEEDKAWTEGKLIFKGTSMKDIAESLERNFGKEAVFNDDEIKNYKITGSFEDNTLEEILYYLSRIKPFTFRITETQFIISGLNKNDLNHK